MHRQTAMALLAAILALQGCAVQKDMVATGGSRADGTVKLAYEFRSFEKPVIDMQRGAATAAERCKTWGYDGAVPFGGETRVCNDSNRDGCTRWQVSVEFQCTGTPGTAMR